MLLLYLNLKHYKLKRNNTDLCLFAIQNVYQNKKKCCRSQGILSCTDQNNTDTPSQVFIPTTVI